MLDCPSPPCSAATLRTQIQAAPFFGFFPLREQFCPHKEPFCFLLPLFCSGLDIARLSHRSERIPQGPGKWVQACGPEERLAIPAGDLVSCPALFRWALKTQLRTFSLGRQMPGTSRKKTVPLPPSPSSSASLTGQYDKSEVLLEPCKLSPLQCQEAYWPNKSPLDAASLASIQPHQQKLGLPEALSRIASGAQLGLQKVVVASLSIRIGRPL